MRARDLARAARAACGHGLQVGSGVGFKHLETFEIGERRLHRRAGLHPGPLRRHLRHRQPRVDRTAELLRRARPGDRGLRRLGAGREGARLGAHGRAGRRADHPDRPRDQAGADRRVGRHRHQRRDPARRHRRPRRHRRRRRGRDARRARRLRSSPACRRGSSACAMRAPDEQTAAPRTEQAGLDGDDEASERTDPGHRRRRPDRLAHRRSAAGRRRRARSSSSTTSSRGRRENLAGASQRGRVTIVEGDIRDRGAASARSMEGIDVVFHQAAIRITQCAEEPRAGARRAGRRHLQRPRGGASAPGSRRWSPPRRPRSTAWPTSSRPTKQHHPYNNRTLYGAAKVFNEGLLRSFNEHVRPRLRRAALLQRLRPAHGHARRLHRGVHPLDGAHRERPAADHLRRRHCRRWTSSTSTTSRARTSCAARRAGRPTRSSTSPAASRSACSECAEMLLHVDGLAAVSRSTAPARKVNPVPRRLADTSSARSRISASSRGGAARRGAAPSWSPGGAEQRKGGGLCMTR